jgi:hypothetical protein
MGVVERVKIGGKAMDHFRKMITVLARSDAVVRTAGNRLGKGV